MWRPWLKVLPWYLAIFVGGWLLSPVWALFGRMQYGKVNNASAFAIEPRLPHWLKWLATPDNSLWGDDGWRNKHCPDYWGGYIGMVGWLYRNAGYGLAWGPLAYYPGTLTVYNPTGDLTITNGDETRAGRAGWYLIKTSDGAFEYGRVWQIPKAPAWCIKFRFGWILNGSGPCLYCCSIRPKPFKNR